MSAGATWSPASRRFCCVRYSTAKCTPPSSRPGIWRSRAHGVPQQSTIASNCRRRPATGRSMPISTPVRNSTPSADMMRQPSIDEALFELELGNAVAQQTADAVGALEDRDLVAGLVELVGRGEAGRTRADDRHALSGSHGRRSRLNPSVFERVLDNRQLDRLDGDRVVVDAEHARAFARRRTQPARPLREVVRRVQPIARRLPPLAVDQIVPVGNDVAEGAALMTERDAAIHAPGALVPHLRVRLGQVHFLPVADPLVHRTGLRLRALDLDETGGLTHWRPLPPAR